LVSHTVWAALVEPTATLPKLRLVGKIATGTIPVPLSATVCGLPLALSVMVNDSAGTAPAAVGVSVTETVQEAPTASVLPQVVAETA